MCSDVYSQNNIYIYICTSLGAYESNHEGFSTSDLNYTHRTSTFNLFKKQTSVPVFYRGNQTWMRMNYITSVLARVI